MDRGRALAIAEECRAALAPSCERIKIKGSIRRGKPDVKDIELVAIPRRQSAGLFDDELITDPGFCAVVNRWPAVKGSPEGKYTQRRRPEGISLDLFMADADHCGLIFAIRTGSAAFSRQELATAWVRGGYRSEEGRLRRQRDGVIVPVREEAELFALLGMPWVEAGAREGPEAFTVPANCRKLMHRWRAGFSTPNMVEVSAGPLTAQQGPRHHPTQGRDSHATYLQCLHSPRPHDHR
jgi:DNA polymerase/3'-5' exonuclease PolX